MNHVACPACALRFTPAQAAGLPACPTCGGALQELSRPSAAMGLRRFTSDLGYRPLPEAIAVAMPAPVLPDAAS